MLEENEFLEVHRLRNAGLEISEELFDGEELLRIRAYRKKRGGDTGEIFAVSILLNKAEAKEVAERIAKKWEV